MTRYQRNPQLASRTIEGLSYIVTADSRLHSLNETASYLWDCLEINCTKEELAQKLVENFQVGMPTALQDVECFLDAMLTLNILEVA